MAAIPDDMLPCQREDLTDEQIVEKVHAGFTTNPHVNVAFDTIGQMSYVVHVFWHYENNKDRGHSVLWEDLLVYIINRTVDEKVTLPFGMIQRPSQAELDRITELVEYHQLIVFVNPTDGEYCELSFYNSADLIAARYRPERDVPLVTWASPRNTLAAAVAPNHNEEASTP